MDGHYFNELTNYGYWISIFNFFSLWIIGDPIQNQNFNRFFLFEFFFSIFVRFFDLLVFIVDELQAKKKVLECVWMIRKTLSLM